MPIMEAENNNTTQELLKQLSNKETDFAEFVSRAENSFIKKDLPIKRKCRSTGAPPASAFLQTRR